jgi:hypothetical protein
MRNSMSRAGIALMGAAFIALGCETQPDDDLAMEEDTAGYAAEEAPEIEPEAGGAGVGDVGEFGLDEQNDSGISGRAQFARVGESVRATVTLEGVTAADTYTAHVHRGTCDEDLGRVTSLEPFTAGATGAESVTMIESTQLTPDEDYVLRIVGTSEAPVACGGIPDIVDDQGAVLDTGAALPQSR